MAYVIGLVPEITIGLFNNIFIVSVIVFDFYKEKHISSSNKLLLFIAISNVSYNIVISAGLLDKFIAPQASSTFVLSSMYIILLLYSISSCAWLSAGLGAFYFLKISQARRLSWVKTHIDSIVPWLVLALEVVSFISGFLCSFLLISPQNSFRNVLDGPLLMMKVLEKNSLKLINATIVVTSMPFMFIFIFTVCIVWTLKEHSRQMERSMGPEDNGRLTPYEGVVRRMNHFLYFYIILYISMLILYFSIISRFWMSLLLMSSFTPLQSLFLIGIDIRLREAWKEVTLRCMLRALMWRQ
ncbi:taste receptor type 2 member 39-like [Dendropsophus ebraccatus]|uniref:taste receptor type 2 member 39-like n=1 Tax=Dendropsophus ebraccatus TaxID=150705 RepID=UPI0038320DCF